MMRIDGGMDWVDLDALAKKYGIKLTHRAARCQHGKTRLQSCRGCEGGYVTDTHTFANVGNVAYDLMRGESLIAVSDDGEDVAYITSARWEELNK